MFCLPCAGFGRHNAVGRQCSIAGAMPAPVSQRIACRFSSLNRPTERPQARAEAPLARRHVQPRASASAPTYNRLRNQPIKPARASRYSQSPCGVRSMSQRIFSNNDHQEGTRMKSYAIIAVLTLSSALVACGERADSPIKTGTTGSARQSSDQRTAGAHRTATRRRQQRRQRTRRRRSLSRRPHPLRATRRLPGRKRR